ncbi:hypothetical protein [Cellulomonas phragmiteti]|uniref:Abortive infection protein-like C-terminal domain-containing protein n=1 Tax=Cellulomonas phragmiteti TaxID=478780 RepID=A0ABQ4DSH2_9CELL|nr:hypothetical protein [Cellulomonas phragmiteti]GIG41947.1 hypothetical protein Cph01nite_37090 [Cellulomonas phragmiteti]
MITQETLSASFLGAGLPSDVVHAMLEEYEETSRRFFLGDYGPAAVNGGRFCEAIVRLVQHLGSGSFTPLNAEIHVERVLNQIENYSSLDDGIRLHVPRAIRLIYGIRNKRDTGHLRGGIVPNLQDATLVTGCLDWILAELVRVVHAVSAMEAQAMIANIVTRAAPIVEEIDGRPVLNAKLPRRDHVLALLYWAGQPTDVGTLRSWLPVGIRKYASKLLSDLESAFLVHLRDGVVYVTRPGLRYVEENRLLHPA